MPLVTCGADGSTRAEIVEQINNNTTENVFNVDSMVNILGIDFTIYKTTNVRGYYNPNDGGGGLFNWNSTTDKSTANAGTIIDPSVSLANQGTGIGLGCWIRQYSGAVSGKWFPTIQNALDNHSNVFIPAGTYTEHFSVKSGQTVKGEGTEKTILTPVDATPVITIDGTDDFIISPVLEGFSVYGTDMVSSTGIRLYKVMRLPQIRDVKVFNFTRGIKLRRVYNLVCDSVWVQSNEIGVFMDSRVNACEFNSLMIINNTVAGIKTEDNYPGEDSLPPYYNKITTVINNCDIENNEIGIHTTGSSLGLILEDNYYENNTQYAIKLDGNVNFKDDATVIGNSTFSGEGSRIYIGEYANYTDIAGNVAHGIGATNYLLDVHASATNLLIGQNRNYGNGLGIYDSTATGTDANIDEYNGSRRKIVNKSLLLSGGNVRITDGSLEIDNMDYNGQVTKFGSRYVWVDQYGSFRHSTSIPSTSLSGRPFVQMVGVPSTATSAGKVGDIASDSAYAYFYTGDGATHQWRRVATLSW